MNKIEKIIFFLILLLSGADKYSIEIAGSTFKLVQIIMIFLLLFSLKKIKMEIKIIIIFIPFFLAHLISVLGSFDLKRSIMFCFWYFFNFIFIITLLYSFISKAKYKCFKMYMSIFRIIGTLTIIQFFSLLAGIKFSFLNFQEYKGIGRPALWFYEPSYLAMFLSIYYSINLYIYFNKKDKNTLKNLIYSMIYLVFTTSTSAYIILTITPFILTFFIKIKKDTIKTIMLMFTGLILIIALIYIIKKDVVVVFIGRLFESGFSNSSGERTQTIMKGIEVFNSNKFGIGGGAYEKYLNTHTPPTNILVEIASTLGILGLIGFLIFSVCMYIRYKQTKSIEGRALYFSLIIAFIMLQMSQNYFRIYIWIQIAMFLGISAKKSKQNFEKRVFSE